MDRPVMDIRPGRPMQPISRPVINPGRPTVAPTVAPSAPVITSPTPATVSTPAPIRPVPAPASPGTAQPATPALQAPVKKDFTPPTARAARPKAPIAAIIIAVFVAAGLIALTMAVYTNSRADAPAAENKQAATDDAPPTPEDVDAISSSVDEELQNLNDSDDFNDAALTDESLGL